MTELLNGYSFEHPPRLGVRIAYNENMATVTLDPQKFELKPYKSLSNEELSDRIEAVRRELGPKLLILGHHYQQDEVIALADLRGDSYGLSQNAAESTHCRA